MTTKIAPLPHRLWACRAGALLLGLLAVAAAGAQPGTTISYSFEETSWDGTPGQVLDTSTYALHGTAFGNATGTGATTANTSPALANDPGTCRYGVFDGVDDYVEVPDNAALNIATELTVSVWINMRTLPSELHTIVSKDTNYEFHIDSQGRVYWWWGPSFQTNGFAITLNQWHHIAVTYRSGSQVIYVDGVSRATAANAGPLPQNNLPFYVGTDWNFISRAFDGFIDEVRILPRYLTQAEVQTLGAETHPCPTAGARFTINHDGVGINCLAETVTVNVIDAIAGTPLTSYNAPVRLDTQTGYGTWALVSGSGAFNDGLAGDGLATYDWPLGQSSAVFALTYPQGPPALDVDAFQVSNTGIRDNDAEGALVFSPNGFTVTAAALANPPGAVTPFATNQTAGTSFALHVAAFGQTPGDSVCGIIEGYSGTKSLKFWSQYQNPGTGTRSVTIDGVAAAASEAGAAAQNVAFVNGQAVVTAKYKDVGRIRVLMKDDTTTDPVDLPTGINGATAAFVSRPATFVLSAIGDAAGVVVNPQAIDATGGVFLKAGDPFRATVTVLDAEGSPTPNYGREALAETVRLAVQLHEPVGGASPPVAAAAGFGAFVNGVATGTDFTWSEVGIVRFSPGVGDSDYLGAGDVTGTASERVGRFIPHHFSVALNAPQFATACNAGGFTYTGQQFGYATAPVITATALAAGGTTTLNYAGAFFKLATATLANRTYAAALGMLDTSALPAPAVDPLVADIGGGNATLTFGSGTGLSFARTTADPPIFASIALSIDVLDADGVAASGVAPLTNPVTFSAIGFDAGPEIRYGRIRIANAVGSEVIDLPVRMLAEYYAGAGSGFVTNMADVCSTNVSLAFSGFTENLGAGETCVRDAGSPGASGAGCAAPAPPGLRYSEPPSVLAPGEFGLRLAAPGSGNTGSVLVNGTVPAWLRYDWNSATPGDENPAGQATFGVFMGESRQIYTREIYR
jgi:MSHA biogenesis protein MshQ